MPTIFLYHLASLTSLRKAPNGSVKRADPEGMMFHTSSNPTSGVFWAAHFYGTGALRQIEESNSQIAVIWGFVRFRLMNETGIFSTLLPGASGIR